MNKPRVYCDFHGAVDENVYAMNCRGTHEDLAEQNVELAEGLELLLWMDDADDNGQNDDLLVDAVVERRDTWGWVARVLPETWRHESEARGDASG